MRRLVGTVAIRELLLVSVAAFVAEAILPLRTGLLTSTHPDFPEPWDHQKYMYMAAHAPLDFHIAPFCWRIATPWLARLLPFNLETNFLFISFVSLALTGVVVYYLSRAFGFSRPMAAAATAMYFSLAWASKFALWDFWLPDALSFLLMTLAIYATVTHRDLLFVATLTAGVAVKESVLFVIPVFYSFRARKLLDLRRAVQLLALSLPAVLLLISLRLGIPQRNADPSYWASLPAGVLNATDRAAYDLFGLLGDIGRQRMRTFALDTLESFTLGTFGVAVFVLPLFAVRRNLPLVARFLPFLVLVYAQVLFSNNTERLLVAGFPALILLALNGVEEMADRLDVSRTALVPLPVLFVGLSVLHVPLGSPPEEIQWLVFIGYLAVLLQLGRAGNTTP